MPSAEQILGQMRRSSEWDGWVPTYSGKGYRPWADEPGEVDCDDIAYGLSNTYRYGGQSRPGVTVAEHSVLVAHIISILWPNKPHLEAAGLMHDTAEAYLHDIQSPLRKQVFVRLGDEDIPWNESDRRVTINIARQFGVTAEHLSAAEVRAADILAACFEKRDCQNLREGDWGLPEIPEAIAHLKMRFWRRGEAMFQFLLRGSRLGLWASPL